MTRRCSCTAVAVASLSLFGSSLQAQSGALQVGGSVIEYDGFLASGAAHLSPSFRYDMPNLSLGAQGTWVVFESGNQILQGAAAAAWMVPSRGAWRAEFSGSLGGAKYENERGYGHLLGRLRVHHATAHEGVWLSGATGHSFGESDETPFELTLGGWAVRSRLALVGTITNSWFLGFSFVDVVGAARWTTARVELEAQAGVRAEAGGSTLYGQVSATIPISERWTVSASGGRYPSDPIRGYVGAKHLSVGVQVFVIGIRSPTPPVITRAAVRASAARDASPYASEARLEVMRSGQLGVIHVTVPGVESVEIMGDLTDWQPVQLVRLDTRTWELRVPLSAGVHRLNIRMDGGPWLVPAGTRLEQTEFGGAVGVIVTPN